MRKNKVSVNEGFVDELNGFALDLKKELAHKVGRDLQKTLIDAILVFYDTYQPTSYKRHKPQGFNWKENSYELYYKNPHNSIIRGGIELTPNNVLPIYRAEPQYVFDLFYSGIHGQDTLPQTEPSPYKRLLNKRVEIYENIDKYFPKSFYQPILKRNKGEYLK